MKIPEIRYKNPPPKGQDILPVIIPVLNRLKLLEQTLTSLTENSHGNTWPIIIDGGSDKETREALEYLESINFIRLYRMYAISGIGVCRNFGASIAPLTHKYIYFSDGDVYFTKGWDQKMITAMESAPKIGLLGGERHPYHGINKTIPCPKLPGHQIEISDQQAGYSMMIRRNYWNQIGPFRSSKPTDVGVEDTDMCNRIRDTGWLIGALKPAVIIHTGLLRSDGTNTAGAEHIKDKIPQFKDILFE